MLTALALAVPSPSGGDGRVRGVWRERRLRLGADRTIRRVDRRHGPGHRRHGLQPLRPAHPPAAAGAAAGKTQLLACRGSEEDKPDDVGPLSDDVSRRGMAATGSKGSRRPPMSVPGIRTAPRPRPTPSSSSSSSSSRSSRPAAPPPPPSSSSSPMAPALDDTEERLRRVMMRGARRSS
jgi:hypothetical protein